MRREKSWAVVLVLFLALAPALAQEGTWAASVIVDSTTDVSDGDTSSIANLIANPGADGVISLREAIEAANNTPGADTIAFNIPACGGVCTLQPLTALPTLSGGGTTIDGYTQPGAAEATDAGSATLLIEIDMADKSADAIRISSAGNVLEGLVIDRSMTCGIRLQGGGATNNRVSGNHIGTAPDGTLAKGNLYGVCIEAGAQNNTVGGETIAERNVISGNLASGVYIHDDDTWGNVVSGNYIGVDASGAVRMGNSNGVGIRDGAQGNTIGGDTPGERNVISANGKQGVYILGSATSGNTISGNYIGTDAYGTADLGNGERGVGIQDAPNNLVGGDAAGERNVIAGNGFIGVEINGAAGNTVSGNYIGVDATGTVALGNGMGDGVRILGSDADYNVIGGDTPGERNVISGNDYHGVLILNEGGSPQHNTVSGNYIGTDASGTAALGNHLSGVYLSSAYDNTIGGSSPGEGNLISGNTENGVYFSFGERNIVSGNYIGTDALGSAALGNGEYGVRIWGSSHVTVGGSMAEERNVISGNAIGIGILGNASSIAVVGNLIGTGASVEIPIGNVGYGIAIGSESCDNTIGPGNVIAHHGLDGLLVDGSGTWHNTITQNSIYANAAKGIELADSGNEEIDPPVIAATAGSYTIVGTSHAAWTVEVFENGDLDGEGESYLGSAVADAGGHFAVTVSALHKPYLTATATDTSKNTSEFSDVFAVVPKISVYLPITLRNH